MALNNRNNNSNNSRSDTHELKSVASDVIAKQTTARSASSGRVTQDSRDSFLQRRRAKFEQNRKVFEGHSEAESRAGSPRHSQVALLVSSFENVIHASSQPSVAQASSAHELDNKSTTSVESAQARHKTDESDVTHADVEPHSNAQVTTEADSAPPRRNHVETATQTPRQATAPALSPPRRPLPRLGSDSLCWLTQGERAHWTTGSETHLRGDMTSQLRLSLKMLREWRRRQSVRVLPLGEDLVEKYLLEDTAYLEYEAKRAKRLAFLAHFSTQLYLYVTSADTCRADVIAQLPVTLFMTIFYKLLGTSATAAQFDSWD